MKISFSSAIKAVGLAIAALVLSATTANAGAPAAGGTGAGGPAPQSKVVQEPTKTLNYTYQVDHYQDVNHVYTVQHNYYVRNNHYVVDTTQVHYSDVYHPVTYVRYPNTYTAVNAPDYVHYKPRTVYRSTYNPCATVTYARYTKAAPAAKTAKMVAYKR
ncbi:MAG: hypothetical protein KIH69_011055 [Anaerolineae bacterium]|nr:hypothetical protein [Anaerolineae bacterium]